MAEPQAPQSESPPPVQDLTGTTVGRFAIRARLGAGGMGEVYRAEDTKLKRPVALKRMAPRLQSDERYRRRFLKEAERASALSDQHIAGLYDVLEERGEIFLVMEYVEGVTLRQRLEQPLSLKEFLALAVQCASALVTAHGKGILHRDLKPENIMLTPAGQVKILDFGVAKRLPRADDAITTETLDPTAGGLSGTPAYMAPEVLLEQEPDGRADIFSLGVVFYEALTGRHPFRAGSFLATSDRILHDAPAPLREANPRVPAELERIVAKMLAKEPAERYATAADLLVDLRALDGVLPSPGLRLAPQTRLLQFTRRQAIVLFGLVVAVVGLALVLDLGGLRKWLLGPPAPVHIESLAVLPLRNLSPDPEQEYFADGMTEALITDLSKIRALRVISRTSVMRYKGTDKPLPQIARELKVDAVVEGSVQRVGGRVRINAQLVHAATDRNLWAESYEHDLGDVLALQNEVARAIVQQVQVQVTPQEAAQLARPRPVAPEVYEAYLKGRYYWDTRTEEGLRKGLEFFQQAIEKDPTYAPAYAGVADSYAVLGNNGILPGKEAFPKAKAAALKALALDDNLAEAHASLGAVLAGYEWDWAGAEREYQRAIQLNPGYATAHHWYALLLAALGRPEEALAQIQYARERDPLSPIINANVLWCLYLARRYDAAIAEARRMLEVDPNAATVYLYLGQAYVEKGRFKEASAAFDRALRLSGGASPQSSSRRYLTAFVYAAEGRKLEAARIMDELKPNLQRGDGSAYNFAIVYATLGDKDQTFAMLRRSLEARDGRLANLNVHPRFDSLRGDARFQELLRRLGLPVARR